MTDATRPEQGEHSGHEVTHGDPGGLPEEAAHPAETHGHEEAALGPIDRQAWGASLLGVAAGLLVCFLLYLAVS
jgi:hypothetical protein